MTTNLNKLLSMQAIAGKPVRWGSLNSIEFSFVWENFVINCIKGLFTVSKLKCLW